MNEADAFRLGAVIVWTVRFRRCVGVRTCSSTMLQRLPAASASYSRCPCHSFDDLSLRSGLSFVLETVSAVCNRVCHFSWLSHFEGIPMYLSRTIDIVTCHCTQVLALWPHLQQLQWHGTELRRGLRLLAFGAFSFTC